MAGAFVLTTNDMHAQVILTQSSYPASVIGTDSVKTTTYTSVFPALSAMVGGLCDMSITTDSVPVFYNARITAVAPYHFAYKNTYRLSGFSYFGETQLSTESPGINEYGIRVEKTKYSLFTITSGLTDSLIIEDQMMLYTTPRTVIAFPAAYTGSWSSNCSADLHIQLSMAAYGLDHAPGIIRKYTTQKDTVTGWGKMRVKDATGVPSIYLNVLQVTTVTTTVDSYFVNGAPISNLALFKLNLIQGTTTTTYQQNYYRPQEVTPLAEVTFSDASYSQAKSARTHVQRLKDVGVAQVANTQRINIYPNPVRGNAVMLDLPASAGNEWTYELLSNTGSVITSGVITNNGTRYELQLPESIPGGLYHARFTNGTQIYSTSIDIIR